MLLICYEVIQPQQSKKNICRHIFATESTRRLSIWVSPMEEMKYWKLHLSYPLLTWATLRFPCGLVAWTSGVKTFVPYLWDHMFLFFFFAVYNTANLIIAGRMQFTFEQWRTVNIITSLGYFTRLPIRKPVRGKTQPMLSARLANSHSKEFSMQLLSLVLQTGEAIEEIPQTKKHDWLTN